MLLPNKKHSDAHLYEIALKEIRDGTYDSALMSKAMTKAKGDQTEGQVMYVEWRVVILGDEEKKRKKEERLLAKKQAKLIEEKTEEEDEEEQEFDSDKPEDKAAEYEKQRKVELAEEKREAKELERKEKRQRKAELAEERRKAKELKQKEKRQIKAELAEEKRKAEQLEIEEKRQQAENKKNRLKSYDETVCTKCGRVNPSASELKWSKIFNCQYCNKENEPINYRDIYGIFHRGSLNIKNFWRTNIHILGWAILLQITILITIPFSIPNLLVFVLPLMVIALIISTITQLFLHPETRKYRARRIYFRLLIILTILYMILNTAIINKMRQETVNSDVISTLMVPFERAEEKLQGTTWSRSHPHINDQQHTPTHPRSRPHCVLNSKLQPLGLLLSVGVI